MSIVLPPRRSRWVLTSKPCRLETSCISAERCPWRAALPLPGTHRKRSECRRGVRAPRVWRRSMHFALARAAPGLARPGCSWWLDLRCRSPRRPNSKVTPRLRTARPSCWPKHSVRAKLPTRMVSGVASLPAGVPVVLELILATQAAPAPLQSALT